MELLEINALLEALSEIALSELTEEFDPNDGRWVTINGRAIFIPTAMKMIDPAKTAKFKTNKQKYKNGKDAKDGFSDKWLDSQAKYKFARAFSMAKNEERIKRALKSEMTAKTGGLSEKRATACACFMMAESGMRVGGGRGKSAAKVDSAKFGVKKGDVIETYGATTLQRRHVEIDGPNVRLNYFGKSGVLRDVRITDQALADTLLKFMDGKSSDPGSTDPLFKGKTNISRTAVRTKKFDAKYKNKDYRTAKAMRIGADEVERILNNPPKIEDFLSTKKGKKPTPWDTQRAAKAMAKQVITEISTTVSKQLGNTPAVVVKSYCSPALFEYALEELGVQDALKDVNPKTGRSKLLPSKFVSWLEINAPQLSEAKDYTPPAQDKGIDAVAKATAEIDERGDSLKAKYPILVELFGEDVVRGLLKEFLSDSDEPMGGMDAIESSE